MSRPLRHRFEDFGGIIASEDPPFLAFVDRQFMREQGYGESPLWQGPEQVGQLCAPTEVHLAATNVCPVGCAHCYMDGGRGLPGELDTAAFKEALSSLARFGVFHVALGGGEALARPDIFELAAFARGLGLVPNLTISGALMTPALAREMGVFGQVNVSLDGAGEAVGAFRPPGLRQRAEQAVGLLLDAGVPTGINCVLGRGNFDALEGLFHLAARLGVNEVEVLRLKPSGRGGPLFTAARTTPQQNRVLAPLLSDLARQTGLRAKIDCSFIPMLCYHRPPMELLLATAAYGCEAGNVLVGVDSEGTVSGCSFLPPAGVSLLDLPARWQDHPPLQALRSWTARAPEPCKSCEYLEVCKGGCHAVALFVHGDMDAPDPDCPWVAEHGERDARP